MIKPFTEALAGFTGLICSLFFIGIVIWCITAFIAQEVTNAMWITLTILVIGYGSTQVLFRYIKRTLE
jgi:hypothetical protein